MKKLVVQNLLKVWLCAMVSFMTVTLYAQGNSFKVSGTVKDNTGELVIGATVIDTKTKNGCVTDVDGNFSLEVTPNSSIKVSFIGYKSQTIAIKAEQKVYNVILQSDNVLIDELVVVGYGVKKKQTLTGAVSAVNTKDIVSTKNESLQNMLTGKIAGLRVVHKTYKSKWFQSSFSLSYDVPWVEGLKLKGLYSYDYIMNDNKEFENTWKSYRDNQVWTRNDPPKVGRTFYSKDNTLWQVQANYSREFNGHNIDAMLLFEESTYKGDNFNGKKELSIPIDQVFAGNADNQQFGQSTAASALFDNANQALVGRVAYDYKSKYLIEFAFRYEGSSKFPANSRWAMFPSVSGGWRVSEEKFWKESSLNFINNLKIRASWGKMGDDGALAYQFLNGYTYPVGGAAYAMPGGAIFDGSFVNASATKGLANQSISWIEAKTFDIGFDLEAWDGLLGLTVDYFRRDRDGLLTTRAASLPGVVGAALPQENLNGDMTRGYEIEISHRNTINEFSYEIKGNFAYARSENKHVEGARKGNSYLNWKQNSNDRFTDLWWGYGAGERFTSWDQIYYNSIYIGRGSVLGDYNYEDWNGDGWINELDEHPLTNTGDRPLINFGLTFNASWKGFDVSLLLQGAAKRHISYDELLYNPLWANTNALDQFMDRWRPADGHADPYDPATKWISGHYAYTGSLPNRNSEFNMQNAAYLRLKTIEVGYNLPKPWLTKIGVQGLRVYLSGYNLFTITGLKYCDPEFPSGNYGYNYPLNKTVTIGANLKF